MGNGQTDANNFYLNSLPTHFIFVFWCNFFFFGQAAEKDKQSQGRVVAIGEGRTTSVGKIAECPFKTGDIVKFLSYAPVEVKVRSAALV